MCVPLEEAVVRSVTSVLAWDDDCKAIVHAVSGYMRASEDGRFVR